MMPEVQTSN